MGGVDNNTNLYCPNWGYCLSEVAFLLLESIESIKGGLFLDFGFLAHSTEQNQCLPLLCGQQHLIYLETK